MKKFLLIFGIIVLALLIFLIYTKRINLQPAREAVDKVVDETLKPITEPIKIKQTTEEKMRQIEQQLEEQNQKLLDDMDTYK